MKSGQGWLLKNYFVSFRESTEAKPSGNFLADDLFGLSLGNDVTISGFTDFTSSAPATNNKPNIEPSKSNYASDL